MDIAGFYYYNAYDNTHDFKLVIMGWAENNRRGVIYINNKLLNTTVAFVAVGIVEFSSVNWVVNKTDTVEKGDDMGYFAVGGSTVLLLFENGVIDHVTVSQDINSTIQMGQPVAVLKQKQTHMYN